METPATATPAAAPAAGTLTYLPVALFGAVMGLTGLALAWHLAAATWGVPAWIGHGIGAIALLAFVAMAGGYLVKTIVSPAAVRAEFAHPVAGKLFGTALIALLLVPMLLADVSLWLARALWAVGAIGMTLLAWHVVTGWLRTPQAPNAASPVWIVPVVGMLDVPLAMPALGLAQPLHGVMVFGLSVGLAFAVPIWTLVFARLLFGEPLPAPQRPALMLMVAPFAVGLSSYVVTTGAIDGFANGLAMVMLFVLAVLLPHLRNLGRCNAFKVSWWAVSFPLAATALAALRIAQHEGGLVSSVVAALVLALATGVILGLLWRTLRGIVAGELRSLSV
jgi:tellurite resistance protein